MNIIGQKNTHVDLKEEKKRLKSIITKQSTNVKYAQQNLLPSIIIIVIRVSFFIVLSTDYHRNINAKNKKNRIAKHVKSYEII